MATEAEMRRYDELKIKFPKAWVPFQWACTAAARARRDGLIDNDVALVDLVSVSDRFKSTLSHLI